MDKVIRAGRMAAVRTVLAVPPVAGMAAATPPSKAAGPAVVPVDVPRPVLPDPLALRREVELLLRAEQAERVEKALAEARDRGWREGREQGLAEGRAEAVRESGRAEAERRARTEAALAAVVAAHEAAWRGFQSQVGEAAFVAACRVLGTRLVSQETVQAIVETVCQSVSSDAAVTARLHPGDAALLVGSAGGMTLPSGLRVTVVADDTLVAGGCVVDAPTGRFDGRLETQLARLRAVMVERSSA